MFARPGLLWLLLLPPVLGAAYAYARWSSRRILARLGNAFQMQRQVQVSRGRRVAQTLVGLSLSLIILGLAGPQWGQERVETRSPYQDVVVVLDVSHSMAAELPSRLERGVRALENLSESYHKRGDVRIGLVLAAAYPRLQLPPSQDYAHFEFLLQRVRDNDLPPELWRREDEKAVSGTRLGAALAAAAKLKRKDKGRGFVILLVSDGDDPLGDDEWRSGLQAAREKHIPVDVLAIGDPDQAAAVPSPGRPGVSSKLNEDVLREIARRTDGFYIPAHAMTQIPLAALRREMDEARRARTDAAEEMDAAVRQPAARGGWFYLAGLLVLLIAFSAREGKPMVALNRSKKLQAVLISLALLLVSAQPLDSVERHIRDGNDAFAGGDYSAALDFYRRAEDSALDPGLVAFNKGVALYELKQFKEAADHFRRSAADEAASTERRAKAYYNLGASLLADSEGKRQTSLHAAVDAFRSSLALAAETNLQDDARYNFELAYRLWLAGRAKKDGSGDENVGDHAKGQKEKPETKGDPTKETKGTPEKIKGSTDPGKATDTKIESGDKKSAPGDRLVVPVAEKMTALSPADLERLLREQVERIAEERRVNRRAASKSLGDAPNR